MLQWCSLVSHNHVFPTLEPTNRLILSIGIIPVTTCLQLRHRDRKHNCCVTTLSSLSIKLSTNCCRIPLPLLRYRNTIPVPMPKVDTLLKEHLRAQLIPCCLVDNRWVLSSKPRKVTLITPLRIGNNLILSLCTDITIRTNSLSHCLQLLIWSKTITIIQPRYRYLPNIVIYQLVRTGRQILRQRSILRNQPTLHIHIPHLDEISSPISKARY